MKNILSIFAFTIFGLTQAQVIIGGNNGTATNKNAVLLEFEAGQNKGIILPYVRTMPTTPTEGTILVNSTDVTKAKVVYYNGTWVDLSSGNEANISTALNQQPATTELANSKAIIGAASSSANGVLVLESTTKAMVLPQVANTDDVKDPAPGMMVYINKTGAKRLAVFNGAKWTYWAPN